MIIVWYEFFKTENLVAVGLVVALLVSLFVGSSELSTTIASGLIGYIGGRKIGYNDTKQNFETTAKKMAVDYVADKLNFPTPNIMPTSKEETKK